MTTPDRRTNLEEPSFESVVKKLIDNDERLSSSEIAALSLAAPEERVIFRRHWPDVPAQRKAHLLGRMIELAEDDANLDFSSLYRIMLRDDTPVVRTAAIQGLWENEDPALINKFLPMMAGDPDPGVRAAAAEALGRFTMLAEYGKLRPETGDNLSESLLSVFNNSGEDIAVRRRALEAAAYLSRPEVREAITDAYDSDNPELRASALFAAGRSLDPSWLETLLDETVSELPELRYEAAVALGEYEDERGVPQLIRLTGDDDSEVKLAAITALGKVGGKEAKRHLEELTQNEDEAVREMAAESLEDLAQALGLLSGDIEAPGRPQSEPDEVDKWDDETYAG
jgi:HEAT repeat protein